MRIAWSELRVTFMFESGSAWRNRMMSVVFPKAKNETKVLLDSFQQIWLRNIKRFQA